jgi:hypothetical protein
MLFFKGLSGYYVFLLYSSSCPAMWADIYYSGERTRIHFVLVRLSNLSYNTSHSLFLLNHALALYTHVSFPLNKIKVINQIKKQPL